MWLPSDMAVPAYIKGGNDTHMMPLYEVTQQRFHVQCSCYRTAYRATFPVQCRILISGVLKANRNEKEGSRNFKIASKTHQWYFLSVYSHRASVDGRSSRSKSSFRSASSTFSISRWISAGLSKRQPLRWIFIFFGRGQSLQEGSLASSVGAEARCRFGR